MRISQRRAAAAAALTSFATAFLACNAIFGITPGQGAAATGSGGTTTASNSSSSGATTTTSSSTGTTASGGMDSGKPLACDGTDPGIDGQTALWANHANAATGFGLGILADATLVVAGNFYGTSTYFGSAPLDYSDAGVGFNVSAFATHYRHDGYDLSAASFTGPGTVGLSSNDRFINTTFHVAVDKQGRTALAGGFRGSFTLGAVTLTAAAPDGGGNEDGFVVLLDKTGAPLWTAKQLGGSINDTASAVAIDSAGDVVVVGVSYIDAGGVTADYGCGPQAVPANQAGDAVFVTKIKPDGTCAWPTSQVFAVANSFLDAVNRGHGLAVAVDPQDNIILVGGAYPTNTIIGQNMLGANTDLDAFVAKLAASDGSVMWRQPYGGPGDQYATAVAVDLCGNILLGGSFTGSTATFDGVTLHAPAGNFDHIFLAKLSVDLAHPAKPAVTQWARALADLGNQSITAIAVNQASDVAIVGNLVDDVGSTGVDFGKDLTSTQVKLAHPGSTPGQMDGYVAKFKADGALRWAKRWGGAGTIEQAFGVAMDDAGHLAMTGYFETPTTLVFGPGVQLTPTSQDVFTVEYGP